MPAAVSVPNTFTAATTAQSAQVNANFAALVAWINTNAVPLDGTKAMTGTLAGPAGVDPTTADQYSRKQYVDTRTQRTGLTLTYSGSLAFTAFQIQVIPWTSATNVTGWTGIPGSTLTVPAGYGGWYMFGNNSQTVTGNVGFYYVTINGTAWGTGFSTGGPTRLGAAVFLNAGDTIQIFWQELIGAAATLTAASYSIHRISL